MATADHRTVGSPSRDGLTLSCTGCGDTWYVAGASMRSWIIGEGDDAGLHFVDDDSDSSVAVTACGRAIPENADGLLLYLAESDAVALERDHPGQFDWCEDCLEATAELEFAGPLPGVDSPGLPGADRLQ